jgi:hypothetical protein
MGAYLITDLVENVQVGNNATQITNAVTETQTKVFFEDPRENLGRLEDYFEFLKSKTYTESDENTTYTNIE